MNFYPPELTTPPLPLVALLGRSDMHASIREFLRSQQKPPVNTISAADPAHASRLFPERKAHSAAVPTCDFFKANWFAKHRQRSPAVAVVLIDRDWVVGDPSSWTRACEQLDWVRTATRPRGVRIVVAIVQNVGSAAEVPEDRGLVLRRRADIEARALVVVSREEADSSLRKLGRAILEQAGQFYSEEVRRVLSKAAERAKVATTPVYSYNLRACFKAAAYSEFRQDWANALKHYQTAFVHCQEAAAGYLDDGINVVQQYAEVCAVAEQLHIKIMALLLHQQRVAEALTHFERHMQTFRRAAARHTLPPAAAAAHWGWACRQYSVTGQLLLERVDASLLPDTRSAQPAYFFQCAADAVMKRRAVAARAGEPQGAEEAGCVAGPFVGQLVVPRPGEQPAGSMTDAQYVSFLAREEKDVHYSQQAIDLLSKAHEGYKKLTIKRGNADVQRAPRAIYHVASLMAAEYLAVGEAANARKLLDSVAPVYRRERWHRPLAATLAALRDCAEQLGQRTAHLEYSLELAALEGALGMAERTAIAEDAVAALMTGDAGGEGTEPAGLTFAVSPSSGLTNVIQLAAGFPAQAQGSAAAKDTSLDACFGVALCNCLPLALLGVRVEVVFQDEAGSHSVAARWEGHDEPEDALPAAGTFDAGAGEGWRRCWAPYQLKSGSHVVARSVAVHLGSATLTWELSAPDGAPLMSEPPGLAAATKSPFAGSAGAEGGRAVEPGNYKMRLGLQTVLPVLSIGAPATCLVGEHFPLECAIKTDGAPLSGATLTFDVQANLPDDSECPELLAAAVPAGVNTPAGPLARGAPISGPLALPQVVQGQPLTISFKIPACQVGIVSVTATLTAPAGPATEATGATTVTATASADVKMEVPFQLTHSLSAPQHSHVLLPTTPKAAQALDAVCVPYGQPFLLSVSLHAAARSAVKLMKVELVKPPDSSLKVIASCGMVAEADGVTMHKGNVHASIFQLSPQQVVPHASLGVLRATWRRLGPAKLQEDDSAAQSAEGVVGGLEALSLRDGAPAKDGAAQLDAPPVEEDAQPRADAPTVPPAEAENAATQAEVCTDIPLPAVKVEEPLLLVRTRAPPSAMAGIPFCYSLEMTNPTSLLQEVSITVGDTSGFVFAGERQASVSILPGQDVQVNWTMVAYSAGLMALPDVQLASARYAARLRMGGSNKVFVMPKEIKVQAASAAT